jgi:hypothetical protein
MAGKADSQVPSGPWCDESLRVWKRLHPGRDDKIADVVSGLLIRNRLKFDFYEFTVLHFIRTQLGSQSFHPAFTVLVKLFRKEDGRLDQIVLNPHLFYCLISAMACWTERPVVSEWVKALRNLNEGDFRIGVGPATLEGTETLRKIKEKWDSKNKPANPEAAKKSGKARKIGD